MNYYSRPLSTFALILAIILLFCFSIILQLSAHAASSTVTSPVSCVLPPYAQPLIRSAVVLSWSAGSIKLDFGNGEQRSYDVGFAEKDTTPALGQQITVALMPDGSCVLYLSFPVYPFTD